MLLWSWFLFLALLLRLPICLSTQSDNEHMAVHAAATNWSHSPDLSLANSQQQITDNPNPEITLNPTPVRYSEFSFSPSGPPMVLTLNPLTTFVPSHVPIKVDNISQSPSFSPSESPNNFYGHVQVPNSVLMLEGSITDVHALIDTLEFYLSTTLRRTSGFELLRRVNLNSTDRILIDGMINLSFTGTAWFETLTIPFEESVKTALADAYKDLAAIQLHFDSNTLLIGNVTVIQAFLVDVSTFVPSIAPSRMPSFRPSQGEIVTICTIQKTQIQCLKNDCEWRNLSRKCRDFVKRESFDDDNKTRAPLISEAGGTSTAQQVDGVPSQSMVAWAFIILAIAIGSIAVLAIVAYVGKSYVFKRNEVLPLIREGDETLIAEGNARGTIPESIVTSQPYAGPRSQNGTVSDPSLEGVYIRSES